MYVTSCSALITLCTEAIYTLSINIKALYAVVFPLYLRSFGHRKIVLQETYLILAKFTPRGLEIAEFLARILAEILLEFTALIQ